MVEKKIFVAFPVFLFCIGCGNKTCTKDTDCILPEVCIAGTCINTFAQDAAIDQPGEVDVGPDSYQDTDDDQITPDGEDMPIDGEEVDGPAPCVPLPSPIRPIMSLSPGEPVDSGSDERAEVITLNDGSFYILGRKIITGDSNPYKLTVIKISTDGTRGSDPIDIFGTTDLPGYHQFIQVQNGTVALFKDTAGVAGNKIILVGYVPGESPSTPLPLPPTDANSFDVNGVDNGSNLLIVWRQDSGDGSTIMGSFVEYSVTSSPALNLAGDGTTDICEPVVAYSGSSYLLAYFEHADPSVPDSQDYLRLLEIDGEGHVTSDYAMTLATPDSNKLVGHPSIVWAGDRFAIFWQEADGGVGTSSHLHLTTIVPGNSPMNLNITAQWDPPITRFSHNQTGELDMVWNGSNLGIIIKHDGGTAGKKIYFLELTTNGDKVGAPILINPGASSSFNPSVTYMETEQDRYYLFSWLQFSASIFQVYTATYGCTDEL